MVSLWHDPVNDLVQEALILRNLGMSVFPVRKNKKPNMEWLELQKKKLNDRDIAFHFKRWGTTAIGCVCGSISGAGLHHIVRDFDTMDEYRVWARANKEIAIICPTVRTHRGRHVHFRCPHPVPWQRLSNGELISDGHFVLMPPSRITNKSSNTHNYEWITIPPMSKSSFPILKLAETGLLNSHTAEPVQTTPDYQSTTCVPFGAFPTPDEVPSGIREAARKTRVVQMGTRNRMIGRFSRALRDVLPVDANPHDLYIAFCYWHAISVSEMRTKEFDVSFRDFRAYWSKTEVSMQNSRPMNLLRQATQKTNTATNRTELLLQGCRALAAQSPSGVFFLSSRKAAEALNVARMTGKRVIDEMVASGRLIVVRKGVPSATERKATEFRLG